MSKITETTDRDKFTEEDWPLVADHILDEYHRRKTDRAPRERVWRDIDRQVRMEPDLAYKTMPDGTPDTSRAWMPEVELPLQAQTNEVLVADANQLLFPSAGPWFAAHAAMTDEYLARADFQAMIAGDENEVLSKLNQDNADKLAEGYLNHFHKQYDFRGTIDKINSESFKYGVGVGRGRLATKQVFMSTSSGVVKRETQIPILVPRSIWNTYLDDRESAVQNEGYLFGPSVIVCEPKLFADVQIAAERGSNNPNRQDGGWMPGSIRGRDINKQVEVIEFEGDLIVPKSTGAIIARNCIVSVLSGTEGGNGRAFRQVIRFRWMKMPMNSYLFFPYHEEDQRSAYPTSPLSKLWALFVCTCTRSNSPHAKKIENTNDNTIPLLIKSEKDLLILKISTCF